jgi:hypothetical protein
MYLMDTVAEPQRVASKTPHHTDMHGPSYIWDSKDTARPLRPVSHIVLFRALATIPFLDPNAKLNLPASAPGPLTATKGYCRFQAGPTPYISWGRNANKRICQRVPYRTDG